jgi:hypothetical protein
MALALVSVKVKKLLRLYLLPLYTIPVSGSDGLHEELLCLLLHPHTSVTDVSVPAGEAAKLPNALVGEGT